jgi:DNA-binding HxlR family transcriptional regulator/putative sterol carrier protein
MLDFWSMPPVSKPRKTSTKRYEQYCPVARSLDVLGERWTLLVVRSLLLGPQRYTDLRDALPGIATDLLTARLRTLEDAGYIQRRELPRPTPATVYELTDSGWRLAQVVLALAQLGVERLGEPAENETINPAALVLSLRASFHPGRAQTPPHSYQLELDGEPFAVTIDHDHVEIIQGRTPNPDSTITTTAHTLAQLLSGAVDAKTATTKGDLQTKGPKSPMRRFLDAFAYPTKTEGR